MPRSTETRNKIPECVAPQWNETKKETVLHAYGLGETKEEDAIGGACVTVEIGADFPIGNTERQTVSIHSRGTKTTAKLCPSNDRLLKQDRETNGLIDWRETRTRMAAVQMIGNAAGIRIRPKFIYVRLAKHHTHRQKQP